MQRSADCPVRCSGSRFPDVPGSGFISVYHHVTSDRDKTNGLPLLCLLSTTWFVRLSLARGYHSDIPRLHSLSLSHRELACHLTMKDQTEVCPLSGTGMFHPVIRTITARRSLFPSSLTCTPNSFPYGSPAHRAEIQAYRVP